MQIWSALGSWPSSVSHFFGAAGGPSVSIKDALANTRTDGAGALLREGTPALLNSMTRPGFAYTTQQVRDAFAAAVAGGSDSAAAAQAAVTASQIGAFRQERLNSLLGCSGPVMSETSLKFVGPRTAGYQAQASPVSIDIERVVACNRSPIDFAFGLAAR